MQYNVLSVGFWIDEFTFYPQLGVSTGSITCWALSLSAAAESILVYNQGYLLLTSSYKIPFIIFKAYFDSCLLHF